MLEADLEVEDLLGEIPIEVCNVYLYIYKLNNIYTFTN